MTSLISPIKDELRVFQRDKHLEYLCTIHHEHIQVQIARYTTHVVKIKTNIRYTKTNSQDYCRV